MEHRHLPDWFGIVRSVHVMTESECMRTDLWGSRDSKWDRCNEAVTGMLSAVKVHRRILIDKHNIRMTLVKQNNYLIQAFIQLTPLTKKPII